MVWFFSTLRIVSFPLPLRLGLIVSSIEPMLWSMKKTYIPFQEKSWHNYLHIWTSGLHAPLLIGCVSPAFHQLIQMVGSFSNLWLFSLSSHLGHVKSTVHVGKKHSLIVVFLTSVDIWLYAILLFFPEVSEEAIFSCLKPVSPTEPYSVSTAEIYLIFIESQQWNPTILDRYPNCQSTVMFPQAHSPWTFSIYQFVLVSLSVLYLHSQWPAGLLHLSVSEC